MTYATIEGLGRHVAAQPATAAFAPGDLSIHFFLQLAVILVVCRVVGWLARRLFGQPAVVGEMIAGVVLGPSLLGQVAPGIEATLFPAETRGVLYAAAQLGVGLYMFVVGTRLRVDQLAGKVRVAALVSLAGIVVPFVVAVPVAAGLLRIPGLFAPTVAPGSAMLFLGACIALTAFPMLARMIDERGLTDSAVGTLSLAAGAFDDACSWCVLAVVLAIFGGGAKVAVIAIGGGVAWTAFVAVAGRRILAPLARRVGGDGAIDRDALVWALAAFCLSAFLMDAAGVHAIFGGFLAGVAMPRGRFAEALARAVEPLTVALLLPIFFTYSGLNTRLDLLASPLLMLVALGITAASILAKGGACYGAARLAGEDRRTALGIGTLMNARGLMELIIVNIGLQRGIIGAPLFAMLVTMAIVTTMMAGPLFDRLYRPSSAASGGAGRRAYRP